MEKTGLWITFLVIALVLAGGFLVFNLKGNTDSFSSGITNSGQGSQAASEQINTETAQQASQGATKEFDIVAKKWEFSPSTITVSEGDTVILKIESVDVEHGFAIPTFGVSESLSPGKEVTVQFVADQKGTYSFFCNVYCGSGHSDMSGTLIVE